MVKESVQKRAIQDRATMSLAVAPQQHSKFRVSRFWNRSCGSRLVSRIGSPQVGQIGSLMGGGPDDCGGGTWVLGILAPMIRWGVVEEPNASLS